VRGKKENTNTKSHFIKKYILTDLLKIITLKGKNNLLLFYHKIIKKERIN